MTKVSRSMRASYSPGGELTEEEWESARENYQIFSSGYVIDKNDSKVKLSDDDFDKIADYYSKFCSGKVKGKKNDALDYSSYGITVYDKDKEFRVSSDGSEQSESVEDIFRIIYPYFAEPEGNEKHEGADRYLSGQPPGIESRVSAEI